MSSLFTGPRSITPWIDQSVFDAIVNAGQKPVEQPQHKHKPKLVQVIATNTAVSSTGITGSSRSNDNTSSSSSMMAVAERTFPRILRVSDGKTHIAAVLTDSVWNNMVVAAAAAAQPTTTQATTTQRNEGGHLLAIRRGVVVCITDWCVYPADVAVQMLFSKSSTNTNNTSGEAWLQWIRDSGVDNSNSNNNNDSNAPQVVLLVSGSVQVLGGEGLGTVGIPHDVHTAVDVRRAFASMDLYKQMLWRRWRKQLLASSANSSSSSKTITNINTPSGSGSGNTANTDVTPGSTTTTPTPPTPAADLPVGDVAALFGSNNGGEVLSAATALTTTTTTTTAAAAAAASMRKSPPPPAAAASVPVPAQLSLPNKNNVAPTAPNQRPDSDTAATLPATLPATTTTTAPEDFTALHEFFSSVIAADKAQQEEEEGRGRGGARAAYDYTTTAGTATATMPTTTATATTGILAPPIPVVAFTDLTQHNALPEETSSPSPPPPPPRKESANGPATAPEVMSPPAAGGGSRRRVLEDADEDDDDDDEQNMGISDMLISETQEPAMEMETEEEDDDEESDQGLETQQAAPVDSQEDLHTQSNNVAGIAAASPGTATTTTATTAAAAAAAHDNGTSSRKRRQYFDERIEWVNMDLVESGIVALPRTLDTPMLTMEKLWRHMVSSSSSSSIPRKRPPSRTESTVSELGGDSIRAMFLGVSD